jgi:hypothetical protein
VLRVLDLPLFLHHGLDDHHHWIYLWSPRHGHGPHLYCGWGEREEEKEMEKEKGKEKGNEKEMEKEKEKEY